jgi:hypothetical protein
VVGCQPCTPATQGYPGTLEAELAPGNIPAIPGINPGTFQLKRSALTTMLPQAPLIFSGAFVIFCSGNTALDSHKIASLRLSYYCKTDTRVTWNIYLEDGCCRIKMTRTWFVAVLCLLKECDVI